MFRGGEEAEAQELREREYKNLNSTVRSVHSMVSQAQFLEIMCKKFGYTGVTQDAKELTEKLEKLLKKLGSNARFLDK